MKIRSKATLTLRAMLARRYGFGASQHGINMEAISKISKLSWRAIEQDYSLDKYEEELEKIARQERNYTPYVVAICTGFSYS